MLWNSGSFIRNITASDQMHLNFSSIKFLPLSVPIIGDAGSLSLYNIKIIIFDIFIIFYDAYKEISSYIFRTECFSKARIEPLFQMKN